MLVLSRKVGEQIHIGSIGLGLVVDFGDVGIEIVYIGGIIAHRDSHKARSELQYSWQGGQNNFEELTRQ